MRIEQHLGFLQEELHKFNYDIEVFDETYLIDKIIEYTATINREAIRTNEDYSSLFSFINVTAVDGGHKLTSDKIKVFVIPKLLSGVLYKNTKGLVLILDGIYHTIGRNTILNLLTGDHSRYSKDTYAYAVDSNRLFIRNLNLASGFGTDDSIILEAILDDQRALLGTSDNVLQMELKVASDAKMHMLIKKDILTLISQGQDGNKDSSQSESR